MGVERAIADDYRDVFGAAPPGLPMLDDRIAGGVDRVVRREQRLPAATWRALQAGAGVRALTPSSLLLAAYVDTLATFSARRRFVVDVVAVGPLIIEPSPVPFAARAAALDAELQTSVGRGTSGLPVAFTSHLSPDAFAPPSIHATPTSEPMWMHHQVSVIDDRLCLAWDVAEALFPPGFVDDLIAAQAALLERLAADDAAWQEPARAVPPQQLALFRAVNDTARAVPATLVHGLVARRAALHPDLPALIDGAERLSHGELRRRVLHAAAAIAQRVAAGADDGSTELVAVAVEPGWAQWVAVLGVLEAGCACVPLDPERLGPTLAASGARLVVTDRRSEARLAWPATTPRLVVDALPMAGEPPPLAVRPRTSHDPALVVYAADDTGALRGVEVTHHGLVNLITDVARKFAIDRVDRVLALAPLHEHGAAFELFAVLAAGGAVVVPAPEERRQPKMWLELMARERVTLWRSRPATAERLIEHAARLARRMELPLRLAFVGGDFIPLGLFDVLKRIAPAVRLVAVEGAPETTLWSGFHVVDHTDPEWRSVPYGQPFANGSQHILDEALAPCPVWVPGVLHCGGAALARGYRGDDERTRAAFVIDPRSGERLYRTGHIARWLPDGSIELVRRAASGRPRA